LVQRTAVITGGGGDMGIACARRLGPTQRLLLADVDTSRLEHARKLLSEDGLDAVCETVDVSNPDSVRALAEHAAALGELGSLVHTAGLSPTMDNGARIWSVNLVGTAHLMESFRPLCQMGSAAVLIASQAGHFARDAATPELEALLDDPLAPDLMERVEAMDAGLLEPGAAYGASKYGMIRMAVREAVPWGAAGGRVVSLSPGIIDTGMGKQEYAAQPIMALMVDKTPLGRMGEAREIASAVAFLCSDEASFVTSTDLLVDGGSTEAMRTIIAGAATRGEGPRTLRA
jgi:NAD(P)-dependent dehydrogenase (short-subunit alcohol dehydrogenase family)